MVVLVICNLIIGGCAGSLITLGALSLAVKMKERKERHEKIVKLLEKIAGEE